MNTCTINEAGKRGPLSVNRLRMLQKEHRLPGFYVGNRFYVRYDMLLAMLDEECHVNAGMAKAH